MVLTSIALAVRISYGLQVPPEVAVVRRVGRGCSLPVVDANWTNPSTWPDILYYGVRGLSAKDVTGVDLGIRATDELVAHIGRHFSNVETLYLGGGDITSEGLLALKSCPMIDKLEIDCSEVDDKVAELLPHLPNLKILLVRMTNVGDGFARAAAQHETLEFCDVSLTNVTPGAVDAWTAVRPPSFRVKTDFGLHAIKSVIRWSDGRVTQQFFGPFEMECYNLSRSEQPEPVEPYRMEPASKRLVWFVDEFKNEPDGDYQFRLKLGDYEAEPVEFAIISGKPSVDRIEFRMTVTRAIAERR